MSYSLSYSLPYPVLGLGDDFVAGGCTVHPRIYLQEDCLVIDNLSPVFTNAYFDELYAGGRVGLVTKVICPSALYCNVFRGIDVISIPQECLANHIEVSIYLVATEDIPDYAHHSFNLDYYTGDSPMRFSVEKNNVVGILGSLIIPLDFNYLTGISGLFRFRRAVDKPIAFDLEEDVIWITYPHQEDSQDILQVMSRTGRMMFLNLFILPALTEAFTQLLEHTRDNNLENFRTERQWAMVISQAYQEFDRDTHPYESAQKFLQQILIAKRAGTGLPVIEAFREYIRD
jgi:hypothetical protein